MTEATPVYRLWSGIDIAAKTFTASWTTDQKTYAPPLTLPYTPEGLTTFQQQLSSQGIAPADTLIVLEASGSYWIRLAVAHHAAGFNISVVNPKQVHYWARSLPRRGKTDALDARMLTQYAHERRQHRWSPPPPLYHELRQRLTVREALATLRQQARNQAYALRQWPVVVADALSAIGQVSAMYCRAGWPSSILLRSSEDGLEPIRKS